MSLAEKLKLIFGRSAVVVIRNPGRPALPPSVGPTAAAGGVVEVVMAGTGFARGCADTGKGASETVSNKNPMRPVEKREWCWFLSIRRFLIIDLGEWKMQRAELQGL